MKTSSGNPPCQNKHPNCPQSRKWYEATWVVTLQHPSSNVLIWTSESCLATTESERSLRDLIEILDIIQSYQYLKDSQQLALLIKFERSKWHDCQHLWQFWSFFGRSKNSFCWTSIGDAQRGDSHHPSANRVGRTRRHDGRQRGNGDDGHSHANMSRACQAIGHMLHEFIYGSQNIIKLS